MLGGAGRVPRIGVAKPNVEPEILVDADLDTLQPHCMSLPTTCSTTARSGFRRTDDPRRRGGQTGSAVGPSIAVHDAPVCRIAEARR